MKLYLRIFLTTSIPFAIFMLIFMMFSYGLEQSLLSSILAGLAFGIFMSLSIGTIHKKSTSKYSANGDVLPIQSTTLMMSPPIEDVFVRCRDAIDKIGAKIEKVDDKPGIIEASTGISWKSWGEKILIQLAKQGDDKIEVQIHSRPRWKRTIVDYGKGRENLDKIVDQLA